MKPPPITIDFETQCRAVLRTAGKNRSVGTVNYVRDPSFRIMCLAYKIGTGKTHLWIPENTPIPVAAYEAIVNGSPVYAHNVGFERVVWREVMVPQFNAPPIAAGQWNDTAALAAVLSLPRALNNLGEALQLEHRKDDAGHKSMLYLSKPLPKTHRGKYGGAEFATPQSHPSKFRECYEYCLDDVRSEHELIDVLPPLSKHERKVFELDMTINDRGIPIDLENVEHAIAINEDIEKELLTELDMITGGKITSVNQNAKMLEFVNLRGVNIANLQKETLRDLFNSDDILGMDQTAKRVLEIRRAIGLASTAKYRTMLEQVCEDGRVRGTLLYHGASTGRWSGKGVQFHNLPSRGLVVSGSDADIEFAVSCLSSLDHETLDVLYGDAPGALKALIRPMVKAPEGKRFIVADFAQIEARVLAWLANDVDALDAYRTGRDSYVELAAKIYDKPEEEVTSAERFMGKSATLGLGYGMGSEKFRATLEKQDVRITEEFADTVVKIYRDSRPLVRKLWAETQTASLTAVSNPDQIQQAGRRLKFIHKHGRLWMILPCGRRLCYNSPWVKTTPVWVVCERLYDDSNRFISKHGTETLADRKVERLIDKYEELDPVEMMVSTETGEFYYFETVDCELRFWSADSTTGKWAPDKTYGAKLIENAAQAISRDFLADSMLRLEAKRYETIFTVHDEIILEVPNEFGSCEDVKEIMETTPAWAREFPLEVEVFEAGRYRK